MQTVEEIFARIDQGIDGLNEDGLIPASIALCAADMSALERAYPADPAARARAKPRYRNLPIEPSPFEVSAVLGASPGDPPSERHMI